jgi:hypothetical protein
MSKPVPKTMKALATLGALAALGAGGAAVSGCGASATLDPVARAAEVSSQQQGAKFTLTMQMSSSVLPGGALAITANGSVDEREHSAEMTMDLSHIPGISALPGGAGAVQMIIRFPTIYMDMPFLAGKLPEGKTWMKLDVTKAAQAAGIDVSQLSSLNQTDPTQFLDYLRASSGDVQTMGSETLDGVPTTHYHATLQLSHILDRLSSSQQAAAKTALEKLGETGAIPMDVWVDTQGRVRRLQMSIGAGAPAGTAGAAGGVNVGGTITMDFTSYGPVPPIVAPPSSAVYDMTGAALNGLKLGGG